MFITDCGKYCYIQVAIILYGRLNDSRQCSSNNARFSHVSAVQEVVKSWRFFVWFGRRQGSTARKGTMLTPAGLEEHVGVGLFHFIFTLCSFPSTTKSQ